MATKLAFLFAIAAGMVGWVAGASAQCTASATTICNGAGGSSITTYVQGGNGGNGAEVTSFGSGTDYWGANEGGPTPYGTTELQASYSSSGGLGTVKLTFTTQFDVSTARSTFNSSTNQQVGGGLTVDAADIFIQNVPAASAKIASTFDYGISLGSTVNEATNSNVTKGIASGIYSTGCTVSGASGSGGCETSNQIWGSGTAKGSSATGVTYGGYFSTSAAGITAGSNECTSLVTVACEASPTVLTSGSAVANLSETASYNSSDQLVVTIAALTDNGQANSSNGQYELSQIFSNFDIFWGTGDCSNAPIYGEISLDISSGVPEPSSLALLATAALGFEYLRRRKRKGLIAA